MSTKRANPFRQGRVTDFINHGIFIGYLNMNGNNSSHVYCLNLSKPRYQHDVSLCTAASLFRTIRHNCLSCLWTERHRTTLLIAGLLTAH